jgi:hypothetical protein
MLKGAHTCSLSQHLFRVDQQTCAKGFIHAVEKRTEMGGKNHSTVYVENYVFDSFDGDHDSVVEAGRRGFGCGSEQLSASKWKTRIRVMKKLSHAFRP